MGKMKIMGWSRAVGQEIPVLVTGARVAKVPRLNKRDVPEGLYLRYVKVTTGIHNHQLKAKDSEGVVYVFSLGDGKSPQVSCAAWAYCRIVASQDLDKAKELVERLGEVHNLWTGKQKQAMAIKSIAAQVERSAEEVAEALEDNICDVMGIERGDLRLSLGLKAIPSPLKVGIPHRLMTTKVSEEVGAILSSTSPPRPEIPETFDVIQKALDDAATGEDMRKAIESLETSGDESEKTRQMLYLIRTKQTLARLRTETILASNGKGRDIAKIWEGNKP